ncbi:MAG TPA: hypothetical protein VGG19_18670 [Tepidisphaeraceae bacterium]|jgi:hypothetical protein
MIQAQQLLPQNSAYPLLLQNPREFVERYRWPLVILILGASADLFTTLWNLRTYGPGIEVHVVQRWVSQIVGVELGVPLAKFAQVGFVILVAAWWRPWCKWILILAGTLYALAAMSNYFLWL